MADESWKDSLLKDLGRHMRRFSLKARFLEENGRMLELLLPFGEDASVTASVQCFDAGETHQVFLGVFFGVPVTPEAFARIRPCANEINRYGDLGALTYAGESGLLGFRTILPMMQRWSNFDRVDRISRSLFAILAMLERLMPPLQEIWSGEKAYTPDMFVALVD